MLMHSLKTDTEVLLRCVDFKHEVAECQRVDALYLEFPQKDQAKNNPQQNVRKLLKKLRKREELPSNLW